MERDVPRSRFVSTNAWLSYALCVFNDCRGISMDNSVTTPQSVGLPPLNRQMKGYVVFVTGKNKWWGDKEEWSQVCSSFGYPYTIRGFAINRAKQFSQHHSPNHPLRSKHDPEFESCVVNLHTGKTEWTSWDNKPTT